MPLSSKAADERRRDAVDDDDEPNPHELRDDSLDDHDSDDPVSDADDDDDDDDADENTALTTTHQRASEEVRLHDQETLLAEEEAARLLSNQDVNHIVDRKARIFKANPLVHRARRSRWKRQIEDLSSDPSELIYKAEEGTRSSSEDSIHKISLSDQAQTNLPPLPPRWRRFAAIHVVIIAAFIALLYGAYQASAQFYHTQQEPMSRYTPTALSNGTTTFLPTTILISLDGFRADFLHRGLTPALLSLMQDGVSPKYMLPSFPSLTFPNHFTLATGLHPESHGIVGNTFWDPTTNKEFYYTDPLRSLGPEWWNGEPIWETAELQNARAAVHMWPGSEAHIGSLDPTYVDTFNPNEALHKKVNRILNWLDMPGLSDRAVLPTHSRPQFIAAYVPNVDTDGHAYGPNSTYIRSTIAEVDGMLASLLSGLDARNLTNIVNVVVVSDHGMATTSSQRLIQFESLIDPSLIEHTDGWPLYGLRPFDPSPDHLQTLYTSLLEKSRSATFNNTFDVYLRDSTMPKKYNFANNPRIAPLWLVPKPGWAIVTRAEYDLNASSSSQSLDSYHPRGLHGYDHQHPLMRAIFIARGPAFTPAGRELPPFQNIEVYNLLCDSLGLRPRPNNGTLRLPLDTLGTMNVSAAQAELLGGLNDTIGFDEALAEAMESVGDGNSTDLAALLMIPPNPPSEKLGDVEIEVDVVEVEALPQSEDPPETPESERERGERGEAAGGKGHVEESMAEGQKGGKGP